MDYQKVPFSIAFIIIVCIFTVSCTHSPFSSIKQGAEDLYLNDKIVIKRQRNFVIPSHSHVLLTYNAFPKAVIQQLHDDAFLLAVLKEEGVYSFGRAFSTVSVFINSLSQSKGDDFTVRLSVMDLMMNRENTEGIKDEKRYELDPDRVSVSETKRLRPYELELKIELIDTRSNKVLDVSQIVSRSGAFGSGSMQELIRKTLVSYTHTISSQKIASVAISR